MAEPPLEEFDARIVQTPLQGLLRNMDQELARQLRQSMASRNRGTTRLATVDNASNYKKLLRSG